MNKDAIISFATGLTAKIVRYIITTYCGSEMLTGEMEAKIVAGAGILATIGWSIWEDRVKKNKAEKEAGQSVGK